ncbi:MAG: C39 family peptidase [Bdellovibrionota bacterium]|nr:peptidase-C39 like family protein [Pseudobdellovibrionaceae bacterium]|tara:strand:- start:4792 stop:5499 length:708 start_codon:yes stop_codon:yes gene_type:complete
MKDLKFDIALNPQPTDTSCGPTCLHGIYRYLEIPKSHEDLIDTISYTEGGGTLGVNLGLHAIEQGLEVQIFTHNLKVFDPSWFDLDQKQMAEKLRAQAKFKKGTKTAEASLKYAEFIDLGGEISFAELDEKFLYKVMENNGPVICGLSASYLYMSKREINETCLEDDVKGYPQGHFVVLSGISAEKDMVEITDPLKTNPLDKGQQKYWIRSRHLINSILIGVITYDANILSFKKV